MTEPVLFVPGMMCDAGLFGPQITHLSARRMVQVASLSYGDSIREMAANVLHLAPGRFALVGAGMGGMVAMEMMRRAPERVNRLALIATTPLPETPGEAAAREPQIIKAQTGNLDGAMETALPASALAQGPKRSATLAEVTRMARALGAQCFVRQSRAMQRRPDAQKVLIKNKIPCMVLCGAHDTITPPKRHEFMAELIPYAELVTLDDAGHLPSLESPEKVNIALDAWLDLPMMLR